jgi:hypothetical protein
MNQRQKEDAFYNSIIFPHFYSLSSDIQKAIKED